MQPWMLVSLIAIVYFSLIFRWFTIGGKLELADALDRYPGLPFRVSILLFLVYLLYCHNAGGLYWLNALKTFGYLVAIPSVFWLARNASNQLQIWDCVALLIIWLPFNFHLFGHRPSAIRGALDLQLIAVSACILCIIYWQGQRQMSGLKLNYAFRPRDFLLVLLSLLALSAILVPTGVRNGFLVLGSFWETELQNSTVPKILWGHLANFNFAWLLFGITLLRAFPEELLFRSLMQTFLGKVWNKWLALIVTSLLFGASHLDNNAKSAAIADWNWTYASFATLAGLAYGLVFQYSSSLLYAILLHALVDALWKTLFMT